MALIVANWKMNGHVADIGPYVAALRDYPAVICPPQPLVALVAQAASGTALRVGGQNCHIEELGAYTGCTSVTMLAELGCSHVIVGHSERRRDFAEDDAKVWTKANRINGAGLMPIVCVGEKDGEDAESVLATQLAGLAGYSGHSLVVAYEPVWAISANKTGRIATPADIENRHKFIKALAQKTRPTLSVTVLYGGSVNPENAALILKTPLVDGALVGAASLKAESFRAILDAAA